MAASFYLKIPKTREFLGGDLLAQSLAKLGVNVAFGLHGGHLDAFLMGCADVGIRLIDTRHESAAVQAAEGYAKVASRVGVCFVMLRAAPRYRSCNDGSTAYSPI